MSLFDVDFISDHFKNTVVVSEGKLETLPLNLEPIFCEVSIKPSSLSKQKLLSEEIDGNCSGSLLL